MREGWLISGNYSRYFQIDKKVYWNHNNSVKVSWELEKKTPNTLPSSSILREELKMIAEAKNDEADKWTYKNLRKTRGTRRKRPKK